MPKTIEKCRRETWLEAALSALQQDGIEAVRVEPLAKEIGVTKGSFYWHFKNRNDLLQQIFSYWSSEMNESIFNRISGLSAPPCDKLFALLKQIIIDGYGRYDAAIRSWAKADKTIAGRLKEIDQKRIGFLYGLIKEAGIEDTDAEIRAQLLYGYLVGQAGVAHRNKRDHSQENLRRKARFIMSA